MRLRSWFRSAVNWNFSADASGAAAAAGVVSAMVVVVWFLLKCLSVDENTIRFVDDKKLVQQCDTVYLKKEKKKEKMKQNVSGCAS